MKKIITKSITIITMLAIVLTMAMPMTAHAKTKAKPKLNKTKVTLTMTNKKAKPTVTLKVRNVKTLKKTIKWTTTNKKVVAIKRTGKFTCKVTARKAGKATIKCKVNGKTLTCKIVVKDKRKSNVKKPTPTPTPVPTPVPTPIDECDHEYKNLTVTFMGNEMENAAAWKLVYHEGLNGCASEKSGNFTAFFGCGRCNIAYKDGNTFSKILTMKNMQKALGAFEGCDHSDATLLCQPNNDECPMPTGYWFVATKQCTKCGEYAE